MVLRDVMLVKALNWVAGSVSQSEHAPMSHWNTVVLQPNRPTGLLETGGPMFPSHMGCPYEVNASTWVPPCGIEPN